MPSFFPDANEVLVFLRGLFFLLLGASPVAFCMVCSLLKYQSML